MKKISNNEKEILLNIKDADKFTDTLINFNPEYQSNIELWDKDLIEHCIKLHNLTIEEFENSFNEYIPYDDFNE